MEFPHVVIGAGAGVGLGAILDQGKEFSLTGIFNWKLRIALIGLGFFALLPILIKRLRKKRNHD